MVLQSRRGNITSITAWIRSHEAYRPTTVNVYCLVSFVWVMRITMTSGPPTMNRYSVRIHCQRIGQFDTFLWSLGCDGLVYLVGRKDKGGCQSSIIRAATVRFECMLYVNAIVTCAITSLICPLVTYIPAVPFQTRSLAPCVSWSESVRCNMPTDWRRTIVVTDRGAADCVHVMKVDSRRARYSIDSEAPMIAAEIRWLQLSTRDTQPPLSLSLSLSLSLCVSVCVCVDVAAFVVILSQSRALIQYGQGNPSPNVWAGTPITLSLPKSEVIFRIAEIFAIFTDHHNHSLLHGLHSFAPSVFICRRNAGMDRRRCNQVLEHGIIVWSDCVDIADFIAMSQWWTWRAIQCHCSSVCVIRHLLFAIFLSSVVLIVNTLCETDTARILAVAIIWWTRSETRRM